jgi:hypothetical protein
MIPNREEGFHGGTFPEYSTLVLQDCYATSLP